MIIPNQCFKKNTASIQNKCWVIVFSAKKVAKDINSGPILTKNKPKINQIKCSDCNFKKLIRNKEKNG